MDKAQFDAAFRECVIDALAPAGFAAYGKTIALRDPITTIALVRLGGRMTQPGGISHVLCFRHSMLREHLELAVPEGLTDGVFDYPFKFLPSEWQGGRLTSWRYTPENLNYRHERIEWADQPDAIVRKRLSSLAGFIAHEFEPWARALTPAKAAAEIRKRGQNHWCERMWLEDYDLFSAGR